MKRTILSIFAATSLLVLGLYATGCTEMPEVLEEMELNRCLTPTNLSRSANGESVTFTWSTSKGANAYILEIYSNADDPDNSTVESATVAGGQIPYTVSGLDPDLTFYARVKAVGDNINDSHWASFTAFETYAIRPNVTGLAVGARTSQSVALSWSTAGEGGAADTDVTAIRVALASDSEADANYTLVEVSSSEAAAGAKTVTGLNPFVKYLFTVHFGNTPRGSVAAYTLPDTQNATRVSNSEGLVTALNDGATEILLSYSAEPYDFGYSSTGADNTVLSLAAINHPIKLVGEENNGELGAFPTVLSNLSIVEGCTSIVLQNIAFNGESYATQHLLSFGSGINNTISEVTLRNCTLTGFKRGIAYAGSNNVSINNFTVDDVIISDTEGDGGEMMGFRGAGAFGTFTITNCTFDQGGRELLRINDADNTYSVGSLVITNNTFNSICSFGGSGLFYACPQPATFTFKGNLFLNMVNAKYPATGSVWGRANHTPIPTTVANNFFYDQGDHFFDANFGEEAAIANGGAILEEDPCVASLGGNLHVINSDVLAAPAGDPRWNDVDYVIPVEDLTLEVVQAPYTWDFTDGTSFYNTADENMVRGNIRFYVKSNPVEFDTDAGRLYFTAAGQMGSAEPTDCAIGFKVNKPGSVVISTSPSGAYPEAHATVSLNGRHVGAVPVDAENYQVSVMDVVDGEESMIYIYGCDPFYITYLQWSDFIGGGDTQLATPEPVISASSALVTSSDPVVISWEAVANAGSYDVMLGEEVYATVTEPSFSVVPSTIGAGVYTFTVIARPAASDTIREASEPSAPIVLDVLEVLSPVSTTENTVWGSADFEWMNRLTGSNGNNVTPAWKSYVHNNLEYFVGNNIRFNGSDGTYYWQFPGTSLSSGQVVQRYMSFIAGGPGKLTVRLRSASSSATDRYVGVMTGAEAPNGTIEAYQAFATNEEVDHEWVLNGAKEGDRITIFANQGIRVFSITWEPGMHAQAGQLETPEVTIDPAMVTSDTESVNVTWSAVEGALSYDVSVDGGTPANVTTNSYTLSLSGLALGEHTVSVIARAADAANDSYEGTATLTIVAPGGLIPVSSTAPTTWASDVFYDLYQQRSDTNVKLGENFSIEKDYVSSNLLFDHYNTHRVNGSEGAYYYQFPGSSINKTAPNGYSRRYMRFLASGNGSLTINCRAAGSGTRSLYVAVGGDATAQGGGTVIDKDGNTTTDGTGAGQATNPSDGEFGDLTWTVKASNGEVVTIFADNGIRVMSITWTPAN